MAKFIIPNSIIFKLNLSPIRSNGLKLLKPKIQKSKIGLRTNDFIIPTIQITEINNSQTT